MSRATRRFARGAGWLYTYHWLERLLDFVAVLVLARILSPDDFGLVAIAASFVTIIEGLAAFDVNKALIRIREEGRELYDTAWTLSVLRGVLAALVMLAIAPFLGDERIGAVLVVLALSPVLTGLANPRFVAFERDLVYSKLAVQTLSARIGSFVVTVAVGILTRSYWALVVGMLVGAAISLALSYVLRPYRPRPSLTRFGDIFGFSGWLSLTTIVTTLSMQTDKLIVGRLLGVAEAGLYFMTQRIGVLPTGELISPLQRVLFPSFSEIVDFVPLALGEQWLSIVPLLAVLVPYLGLRATLSTTLPCVMALGRTRLLFWVSFIYALVHLPAFIAGTALFGLEGAIGSIVVAGVLYTWLNVWMLRRTVGIRFGEILGQLRRPLLATGVMVAALLALGALPPLAEITGTGSWLSLAARIAVGGLSYVGTLYATWRLAGRPDGIERRLLQLRSG